MISLGYSTINGLEHRLLLPYYFDLPAETTTNFAYGHSASWIPCVLNKKIRRSGQAGINKTCTPN